MGQVVHIVLTKVEPCVPDVTAFTAEYNRRAAYMMGKIPGMLKVSAGDCLEAQRYRTLGFTHMLYAVFEDEAALNVYATHPVHQELKEFTKDKLGGVLAFDLEI